MYDWLAKSFETLSWIYVAYFFTANFFFLMLLLVSFWVVRRTMWASPMIESIWTRIGKLGPSVSIIAPAHNESNGIIESTLSFLSLNYPEHEVIVVNDASTDDTLERLIHEFHLEKTEAFYDDRLSKTKVRGIFRSRFYRNLLVVDKEHGGKADSINVGIGFARGELICSVDCDSILDDDALIKVALPFVEEPETVIASGGTVRPVNGCKVELGRVVETGIPHQFMVIIQTVEYLRAFLFGRIGWNALDCTLIISGAFGVFRRDIVIEAGGFLESAIGEDMELVLRLRRWIAEHHEEKKIAFIPDPICWTQVPSDWKSLSKQRRRWHRGLCESLYWHKKMFLNFRYGAAGLLAYPYFFIFELLGPIFELTAYLVVFSGFALGWVKFELVLLVILVDIIFGVLMSMGAVLIEESAYHKYPRLKFLFLFLIASVVEPFGYRQFTAFYRLLGLIDFIRGKERSWGKIQREKFA